MIALLALHQTGCVSPIQQTPGPVGKVRDSTIGSQVSVIPIAGTGTMGTFWREALIRPLLETMLFVGKIACLCKRQVLFSE